MISTISILNKIGIVEIKLGIYNIQYPQNVCMSQNVLTASNGTSAHTPFLSPCLNIWHSRAHYAALFHLREIISSRVIYKLQQLGGMWDGMCDGRSAAVRCTNVLCALEMRLDTYQIVNKMRDATVDGRSFLDPRQSRLVKRISLSHSPNQNQNLF